MRPKFTLTNLLLLTAIVAMGTQMYRNHCQIEESEVKLARHQMVYAQKCRVRKCELDLQVAKDQVKPELQVTGVYRWVGFDDASAENAADPVNALRELSVPVGTRSKLVQVRNAELQLVRARSLLQDLELELDKYVQKLQK